MVANLGFTPAGDAGMTPGRGRGAEGMMRQVFRAAVVAAACASAALGQESVRPPVRVKHPVADEADAPGHVVVGESPPAGFGVDAVEGVRPPMPVSEAPIEIPPGPLYWTGFDYLLLRSKGGLLPALGTVVLGNPAFVSPVNPLNAGPITDNRINGELQSGFRLTVGHWLEKPRGNGVEARYSMFLRADNQITYGSSNGVLLSRPFWDELSDRPALQLLSSPTNDTAGLLRVKTSFDSDTLELNYLRRGNAMIGEEAHWIMGVRYWSLDEDLTVESLSRGETGTVGTFDRFSTHNKFLGPQFGSRMLLASRKNFTFELSARMAIGVMHERVEIHGATSSIPAGGAQVDRPGGFLALATNSGDHERMKLALIRDMSFTVGWCVTENVTLRLAYNVMNVSNVVRPGEQIDLGINPSILPFNPAAPTGDRRPGFRFNEEMFFMHGVTLGLSVQF